MSNSIEKVIQGLEEIALIARMLRLQSGNEAFANRLEGAAQAILDGFIQLSSVSSHSRAGKSADFMWESNQGDAR